MRGDTLGQGRSRLFRRLQFSGQCSAALQMGPAEVAKLVLKFVLVILGQGRQ
jgi:hypothetical protein